MNTPLPHDADTLPWYQQFWPWFLILLPTAVVIASFATLYIATRHADDMVVDEYYKEGLAINRQLARIETARQLGIAAEPRFDGLAATLQVTGPVTNETLLLRLSHPLEADRDFDTELLRIAPGLYRGALVEPVTARWHWTLQATAQPDNSDDDWRVDGVVQTTQVASAEP